MREGGILSGGSGAPASPLDAPWRVLIVDDEPPARVRLRALITDLSESLHAQGLIAQTLPPPGEAASADEARRALREGAWDIALLDIRMPGTDGLSLASEWRALPQAPALVFVTAHAEHALRAFEMDAVDYLTKPVRRDRLQQALEKAARWLRARQQEAAAIDAGTSSPGAPGPSAGADFLVIHDRGRTERVALVDIVYLKAEYKYVTVRTASRALIYDGSLQEIEQQQPTRWLRVHRNALVARGALRTLERARAGEGGDEAEAWLLRLHGVDEPLQVSRRQLAAVREAMALP